MSRNKWSDRVVRVLSGHIDRLRDTLGALSERLRAAISQAIGGTVAGAVQDAVYLLLEAPDDPPSRPSNNQSLRPARRRLEDEDWPWDDEPDHLHEGAVRGASGNPVSTERASKIQVF